MKSCFGIFGTIACAAIIGFSMTACPNDDGKDDKSKPVSGYRILAIGNSYSQDAMRYIRDILVKNGVDNSNIDTVNAYIGGCTLQTHANNARSDSPAYERQTFRLGGNLVYPSSWDNKLKDIITSNDWDVITLQQASVYSGKPDTYNSDLTELIAYVKQHATNPNVKLGWHMTWAYAGSYGDSSFDGYGKDQMTMYNAIVSTVPDKIKLKSEGGDFDFIIPSGTAVQNGRTTTWGDNLNSDGTHLNDRGRFIAAAAWVRTIYNKGVAGIFTSTFTALNGYNLTSDDMARIEKCVKDAADHPFAVTNQGGQ
jgi:hypothetical protein